jgi:CDP-paratose 2-epimerase
MRVLITGGAGFVGSRLALAFRRDVPGCEVVAFDNLRRRGSELNMAELQRAGVEFAHGDVRSQSDLNDVTGTFDVIIDAAAEPSVHAGVSGSPRYVIDTNLGGTLNLLDVARERGGVLVFLSTSRVYSMAPLRDIATAEGETRLEVLPAQVTPASAKASPPTCRAPSMAPPSWHRSY